MKQKGLAPLVIIILIALAVGGYLLYQKQFKSITVFQPSLSPAASLELPGVGETANPDLIGANWKTYTNTKYGYSFQYPSNWVETVDPSYKQMNVVRLDLGLKDQKYYFIVGTGGRGGPPMDEIKGDNPKYGNISFARRAWIKDGTPFYIIALPDRPYSTGGNIEINFPPAQSDYYSKIFDQILSTFKFTQ